MSGALFEERPIKPAFLTQILATVREYGERPLKKQEFVVENQMLRQYIISPDISYSQCRTLIQPDCPGIQLTDAYIRSRATSMNMTDRTERTNMAIWARSAAETIYQGFSGDHARAVEAEERIEAKARQRKKDSVKAAIWYRLALYSIFEFIPQLHSAREEYRMLIQLGDGFAVKAAKKILEALVYDTATREQKNQMEGAADDPAVLRRDLYLARKELTDYRELVEAADREFEDKLETLKNRELTSFFAQLNEKKYGYLIDTSYTLMRGFQSLGKQGYILPYEIEGAPAMLRKLISFLRDAGISPATSYQPNSIQRLSPKEIEGTCFEADPARTKALDSSAPIDVRVLSSGWKYHDEIISLPVFQEVQLELQK